MSLKNPCGFHFLTSLCTCVVANISGRTDNFVQIMKSGTSYKLADESLFWQEERERQRQRERERELREEDRRRRNEVLRQREIEKMHREETMRLER